jgi:hypothetical protein
MGNVCSRGPAAIWGFLYRALVFDDIYLAAFVLLSVCFSVYCADNFDGDVC